MGVENERDVDGHVGREEGMDGIEPRTAKAPAALLKEAGGEKGAYWSIDEEWRRTQGGY
jgi:hypothetical protein